MKHSIEHFESLQRENSELRARLAEAEETLHAIRSGEVDAVVVQTGKGDQVFTLKGAERPYRNLVESINEGAVIIDPVGIITYSNRYFAKMLHTPLESVIGRNIIEFVPVKHREQFDGFLTESRLRACRTEFVISGADGVIVPVYLSMNSILVDEIWVTCLIATDLTEQKQLERAQKDVDRLNLKKVLREQFIAELRASERRFRELADSMQKVIRSRDAAIRLREDMMSIISHDLRSPITAINLSAELLDDPNLSVEKAAETGFRIRQSAARMLGLISNLLQISELEAGTLQIDAAVCSTEGMLAQVLPEMRQIAGSKGIEILNNDFCPNENLVCDKERIAQVFSNIIDNAIKFVPEKTGRIVISSRAEGENVVFTVSDNGPGIDQADLPYIFDRFWHARRTSRAGAGLGLAIAKGIVESHFGTISVNSKPGIGAEFVFTVPRESSVAGQLLLKRARAA